MGNVVRAQSISVKAQGNLPMILPGAASGTIAVQTGTNVAAALSTMATMPWSANQPCYVYLAAGCLASGVPATAGFYYGVVQSSTAITVYNTKYAGGTPLPGALATFSSITSATITPVNNAYVIAYQYLMPGATMGGVNDSVEIVLSMVFNSSTNAKRFELLAGTAGTTSDTVVWSSSDSTSGHLSNSAFLSGANQASASSQVWAFDEFAQAGTGANTGGEILTTFNMANALYLSTALETVAATDFVAITRVNVKLIKGVS
jgi:hypothetical protein